jgi:hypothetical protein
MGSLVIASEALLSLRAKRGNLTPTANRQPPTANVVMQAYGTYIA